MLLERKMEITADDRSIQSQALQIAKRQRILDVAFKYLTQFFALSVLFALLGIIASLVINASPALKQFGLINEDQMVYEVEE